MTTLADAPVAAAPADPWTGFEPGAWSRAVDVRDFIQRNYTPYEGGDDFLAPATARTLALWDKVRALLAAERALGGLLDAETRVPAGLTAYGAGYIDRTLELIVGLQTDAPLKRGIYLLGGVRTVAKALEETGRALDPGLERVFTQVRKTHNEAVFDVYTSAMRAARRSGVITGLPDAYGRGRIIGDYRRVALDGVDRLIADKKAQHTSLDGGRHGSPEFRLRNEIAEQVHALEDLKAMAAAYGFDISGPARDGREAVQWTYFAYLGAVKEQDGAAMSLGRVSTFLDIYLERDIRAGRLTAAQAQELVDDFGIKLRIVRFLRTHDYNQLFSGDPTWVTEAIGGMGNDGRTLVTRTSFRFLHTLSNLGPAPEPNLTVLWSERLPQPFKDYCAAVSIATSSVQYESDDLMRPLWGDDYGIACCVSAMAIGKQMQYFGARANLAKALLYAINGGRDEVSGETVAPGLEPVTGDVLDHDDVMRRFERVMAWLAGLYIDTLNAIHWSHDRFCYERLEMALHDRDVFRTMACGIAGLSIVADSLSAMKHARVHVIRDARGLATDFAIEGEYPAFGNNDDRVDAIAVDVVEQFMRQLRRHPCYRGATPTLSVLTITSNVVYGKKTGGTPDGRKAGEPFAPGANPMHGRDRKGAIASMLSVAKLPYEYAKDGISYTFSIVPRALGRTPRDRIGNLTGMLDGYFGAGGHHVNVNVLDRETLLDAMDHPERYPQLTLRVSGYAVHFIKLTREQQLDVVNRTFHDCA